MKLSISLRTADAAVETYKSHTRSDPLLLALLVVALINASLPRMRGRVVRTSKRRECIVSRAARSTVLDTGRFLRLDGAVMEVYDGSASFLDLLATAFGDQGDEEEKEAEEYNAANDAAGDCPNIAFLWAAGGDAAGSLGWCSSRGIEFCAGHIVASSLRNIVSTGHLLFQITATRVKAAISEASACRR